MQYLALRGIQTSFIKRHRSLINARYSSLVPFHSGRGLQLCSHTRGKIRVDSRILGARRSINNTIHASTYRPFRGRVRGAISLQLGDVSMHHPVHVVRSAHANRRRIPFVAERRVGVRYSSPISELRFRYRIVKFAHRRAVL